MAPLLEGALLLSDEAKAGAGFVETTVKRNLKEHSN